jgi:hypothetical protein
LMSSSLIVRDPPAGGVFLLSLTRALLFGNSYP